jgi:hypothetical protein
MGSGAERRVSRWVQLLKGEHAGDPETIELVLSERWDAALSDFAERAVVAAWTVSWLLTELEFVARLGQSYLLGLSPEIFEVYAWRSEECLRRAVAMAERCLDADALPMELSAAVRLVSDRYRFVPGSGTADATMPEAVEAVVERLGGAARVLAGAIQAESRLIRPDGWVAELERIYSVPCQPTNDCTSRELVQNQVGIQPKARAVRGRRAGRTVREPDTTEPAQLTLDSRASATATQWETDLRPWTLSEMARHLDVSRQRLYQLPTFMRLWKQVQADRHNRKTALNARYID